MNAHNFIQCAIFMAVLLASVKPLGLYMAGVYEHKPMWIDKIFSPIEWLIYKLSGIRQDVEMNWKTYAIAMMLFNMVGMFVVYLLQRLQVHLPLNPMAMTPVSPDSSFNTAVSFATNTNWQGYGGETTMSYLTQMLALTVQNFLSAATGMAVLVAMIRGFARKKSDTIGNFWVDLVRTTLYILLPMSVLFTFFLVWQGVPQTFRSSVTVPLVQSTTDSNKKIVTDQTIAVGPKSASQEAIKMLGVNGGGYFNVNSAHPYENPTAFANFHGTGSHSSDRRRALLHLRENGRQAA